jgi:PmbA protein
MAGKAAGWVGEGLLELATRAAGWARPGEEVEAYISRGTQTQVKAYEGEVESVSGATSAGAGIRVVAGGRQGFCYTGSLELDDVEGALEEARDNAAHATPEAWVGLPSPDGCTPATLDLWREDLAQFPTAKKVEAALELDRQARSRDPRARRVESANWFDGVWEVAIASSLGVLGEQRATACGLSVAVVAGEGAASQVGSGHTFGRSPEDLSAERAADDAVSRAVRLLGATKARSARLPVVFEPRVTATLFSLIASALSGERVLKGVSLFAGRLGEAVASPGLTLVDDPTDPAAWGASAFDDEGLACRRNVLVAGGTLQRFLYDTASARRAGTQSTASAVRGGYRSAPGVGAMAVSALPGSQSLEAVLAQVGDGLLVQSVSGVHSGVNLVSGDFSVGAEGLMVRGGEPAEPVREVTIASSIQRMLQDVVAVGNDLEWLPSRAAGLTLAVSEMSMSGA